MKAAEELALLPFLSFRFPPLPSFHRDRDEHASIQTALSSVVLSVPSVARLFFSSLAAPGLPYEGRERGEETRVCFFFFISLLPASD